MQTLQIITMLMSIVAYCAMTFLAGFAFVRIRRLSNEVGRLHHDVHATLCITMGEHIRNDVDELNSMKVRLEELLEDDRFEDAVRLKKIIEHQEHQIDLAIARFKDIFGEDAVKVEVTNFRVN